MNARDLLALGVVLAFWSCSPDRSAGGTAETENSASAREYRVDSLLPDWILPICLPTVATLRLDSSNFDFTHSDPSGRDLDVRKPDGTPVPFEIVLWDPASFRGRLRARIGTDLLFPGSRIALWSGLASADRTNSVGVWSGIPDSLRTALTSVLVDDFEGGSLRTRLPDSSTWFVISGTGTGIAPAGDGRTGNALRLVDPSASSTPVALAAALLATTPRYLGSVDSIVFWARGTGVFWTSLQKADASGMTVAWTSRTLSSSWQRFRITPSEFDTTARTSNVGWVGVEDSVSHLSFWMSVAGELWIDDPRIYGIDPDDLR
ncbi:MAG TPA: hypothetical protein VN931_04000 [Fibrobacteria bacterium]|nr:hypothetical protein [Fibrobacteria bacterium]